MKRHYFYSLVFSPLLIVGIFFSIFPSYWKPSSWFKKGNNLISAQQVISEKELTPPEIKNKNPINNPLLVCIPISRSDCESGFCENKEPSVSAVIDKNNQSIGRCDVSGCDKYPAQINESGIFINAQTTLPRGWFIKVNNSTLEYTEVVTLGLTTLISYGSCSEQ